MRAASAVRHEIVLVIDTSALLEVLIGRVRDGQLLTRLTEERELHCPHLLDIEVLHALRGLVRRGQISSDRAADARVDLDDLTLIRYPHPALADRIWGLRENLSAHDAAFVALAEALDAPLVTCDARLARAPSEASIEVYPLGPS